MLRSIAIGAAFAVLATVAPAAAQQLPSMTTQAPTIKRTPLQKIDVPEGSRETVMALAEIVPNVLIGKHTHPGPEVSYLLEGELTLMVQGQADKTYKAGDTFSIPGGVPHDARTGPSGAKVLATYIVEKGKPLASPAP